MPTYADWKAPYTDSDVLIWPDPAQILSLAHANHRALHNADFRIHDSSLTDLRKSLRAFLGIDDDHLAFVTGHQAELWHPGVWAKNVLINAAAEAADPTRKKTKAIHIAVDTDEPKHLELRWPVDGSVIRHPITDDPNLMTSSWASQLASPTPAHLQKIEDDLVRSEKSLDFRTTLHEVLHSMRKSALEGVEGTELPGALASACHQLDWSLGLDYTILTLSPLLNHESWLTFIIHVLKDARHFASSYNDALAGHRNENGIKSKTRPMPDLMNSHESIELPFWLDELKPGIRRRASLRTMNDRMILNNSEIPQEAVNSFTHLRSWLIRNNLRIAPRALMLTIFLRLLMADLFIHGIGGGRYDQVADRIIKRYFKIEPPGFAVTTATLYWPGALTRERACLPGVISEGHRLHHTSLGGEKKGRVKAIASAPRHSAARTQLFQDLRRDLRKAAANSPEIARWQEKLESTRRQAIEDEIIFDRELFYAIQPKTRLAALIQNFRDAFAR